ncbi:MAG: sulfatase-like hydrolase/transferase, partial [Chloroflexota bacterium]
MPPNLLLIMTDQQRADFSQAAGFPLDTTPFLDALGQRGARFAHAYTPMPVCAPARCSLLTGRYPKATHVRQNSAIKHVFRPEGLPDLVDTLRAQGYSINLAGKNHTYLRPEALDFASLYSHHGGGRPERLTAQEQAMDAWLRDLATERGSLSLEPTPFPLECQPPYRLVRDAMECLEAHDDQGERPFFLFLSFPEPHNPYQ